MSVLSSLSRCYHLFPQHFPPPPPPQFLCPLSYYHTCFFFSAEILPKVCNVLVAFSLFENFSYARFFFYTNYHHVTTNSDVLMNRSSWTTPSGRFTFFACSIHLNFLWTFLFVSPPTDNRRFHVCSMLFPCFHWLCINQILLTICIISSSYPTTYTHIYISST